MTQPWIPPVGNNWTDITMLIRQGLGHDMTVPEGDQNKTDANNAINWIGRAVCAILQNNSIAVTGFIQPSYRSDDIVGWLLCDHRTIGPIASNSTLVGAIYQDLYEVVWIPATNSDLLTSAGGATTKGATAADDWAANKRLYLPDLRGRTLVASGQGIGLTNRLLGEMFGAEFYADARTYGITNVGVTGSIDPATLNVTGGTVTFPTFSRGTLAVYTPGTLPSSSGGAFPTFNPGTLASYVAGTLPSSSGGSFPTFSPGTLPVYVPGTLPTSSGGSFPTLAVSGGSPTIDITLNYAACVQLTEGPNAKTFPPCDITGTVLKTDIFSSLDYAGGVFPTFDPGTVAGYTPGTLPSSSGGAFPTFSAGTLPVYTAGTLSSSSGGTFPTFDAGILALYTPGTLPSSSGGNNNLTGATVDIGGVAITGVANGLTDANPVNITTLPPSFVVNYLIKI